MFIISGNKESGNIDAACLSEGTNLYAAQKINSNASG